MEREIGDPGSCLLLCSVLMAMEEEEGSPSSSEEEEEEKEDVALDSDMEQVCGRNLAPFCPRRPTPRHRRNPQLFTPPNPVLGRSSHPGWLFHSSKLPSFLPEFIPLPAQVPCGPFQTNLPQPLSTKRPGPAPDWFDLP